MQKPDIFKAIEAQRPGYTLDRGFYACTSVFDHEVSRLLPRNWLLIDHGSRIPDAGDYFTLNLFGDSVIVIRGRDGDIHAHYNLCRHRGSQIVRLQSFSDTSFVLVTEALARFLFEFRRPRLCAATGAFGLSVS
ncbi:Rieske 2Fe-2S domain-containing protein [Roseovarius sp.]|uniref:Rieske 2Fe-2S domain-containing protein n=1 Tax=Roseovarius sp. TaxID=1486281 RepID=UPI003BACB03A